MLRITRPNMIFITLKLKEYKSIPHKEKEFIRRFKEDLTDIEYNREKDKWDILWGKDVGVFLFIRSSWYRPFISFIINEKQRGRSKKETLTIEIQYIGPLVNTEKAIKKLHEFTRHQINDLELFNEYHIYWAREDLDIIDI